MTGVRWRFSGCCRVRRDAGVTHRDGLQQFAVAGLLAALAVLAPGLVLYAAALSADVWAARWCARQWLPAGEAAAEAAA